ncbi:MULTISPECIES: NAD-dependent epimerase/dehydratase family protein [Cytobacillus]|uniref:NAD-dependent epimerase/dehydratase family protein n=1 Tax=Cytobacillus TaxID=2675230 RepID=UPI00203B60E2|nr:NAD-dependent epimerase/dehydratase family protein [Cytobacillus kochii]MCM3321508.1 GDP-mannose 4,6-dehydratase [Cytobacillus kochii]MCM3343658.1 GDP-mannose 4,6-dehydratase [Cytobacillus kochii]MDM5207489.1 GDP-mannose 4,6-dehydratase [Cytobacillus kochii]
MNIVISGGAGFIGSHLVDYFIKEGAKVYVIDNFSSSTQKYLHPESIVLDCDIRSDKIKQHFSTIKPDLVFHLAAQADVTKSIKYPTTDADINIVGTINLLEASVQAKVKQFIFSSTSAVYGESSEDIIHETDPTQPISYYGMSKYAAENYIRLYHHLYQLPYTILRYGNVYGPRQTPKGEGGVIAVFLQKILSGESLNIHGNGEQTRDFIFVDDIVLANVSASKQITNDTYHVSTGLKTSVNQIIEKLSHIHSKPIKKQYVTSRQGDIKDSCLSREKIKQKLNWVPHHSIDEGLLQTYQFMKNKS